MMILTSSAADDTDVTDVTDDDLSPVAAADDTDVTDDDLSPVASTNKLFQCLVLQSQSHLNASSCQKPFF